MNSSFFFKNRLKYQLHFFFFLHNEVDNEEKINENIKIWSKHLSQLPHITQGSINEYHVDVHRANNYQINDYKLFKENYTLFYKYLFFSGQPQYDYNFCNLSLILSFQYA